MNISNEALLISITQEMKKQNYKPMTDYLIDSCMKINIVPHNWLMYMFYVFCIMFVLKLIKRILLNKNIEPKFYNPFNLGYKSFFILKRGYIYIIPELIELGQIYIYAIILNYGLYIILR